MSAGLPFPQHSGTEPTWDGFQNRPTDQEPTSDGLENRPTDQEATWDGFENRPTDRSAATDAALLQRLMRWGNQNARRHLAEGSLELALRWVKWASQLLCDPRSGLWVSRELEDSLLEIADRLPRPPRRQQRGSGPRRWLHVFTKIYPTGGHTSLACRWIESDADADIHGVVLLEQEDTPLRESLLAAARASGGQVHILGPEMSLVERARWLRFMAWADYDAVVLHVHQYETTAAAAFGVPGGPPVLFMNHADHLFWIGATVADRVLHIRPLAAEWSKRHRGIDRTMPLPIPVADPVRADERARARADLGIPAGACVLLSIGAANKFPQVTGSDFLVIAEQVLQACPDAHLLVVGPGDVPRWREAMTRMGKRFVAYPPEPNLQRYHQVADIYLDPFPLGSLTALLEVARLDIPCVLAPRTLPYPLYADDGALAVINRPADVGEYVQQIQTLVQDPLERQRQGNALGRTVRTMHCGSGWQKYLAAVKCSLPPEHAVYPLSEHAPLPAAYTDYWQKDAGPLSLGELFCETMLFPVLSGLQAQGAPHCDAASAHDFWEMKPLTAFQSLRQLLAQALETSLYVDCGHGYSEGQRIVALAGLRYFHVTFDLSSYRSIREVRWDPLEGRWCRVRIVSISARDRQGGDHAIDLAATWCNGELQEDGAIAYRTTDPSLFIPLRGDIASLTIQGHWEHEDPAGTLDKVCRKLEEKERKSFAGRISAPMRLGAKIMRRLRVRRLRSKAGS
jgi:glycosyltransferase involved in cell wall biosynthesis